ncbi:hypothetical protein J11TS1_01870 [Oceanobacillus sp. J11TS1]|nr:hypothetical protein J11TS1_01870 [Oceanobacillus sp. J11TS1]
MNGSGSVIRITILWRSYFTKGVKSWGTQIKLYITNGPDCGEKIH